MRFSALTRLFEPICLYTRSPLNAATFSREHVVPKSIVPAAKSDVRNIWPCDRWVNSVRGNLRFATWGDEDGWEVDHANGIFKPPRHARGAIARTCVQIMEAHDCESILFDRVLDAKTLWQWYDLPLTAAEFRREALLVYAREQSLKKIQLPW